MFLLGGTCRGLPAPRQFTEGLPTCLAGLCPRGGLGVRPRLGGLPGLDCGGVEGEAAASSPARRRRADCVTVRAPKPWQ